MKLDQALHTIYGCDQERLNEMFKAVYRIGASFGTKVDDGCDFFGGSVDGDFIFQGGSIAGKALLTCEPAVLAVTQKWVLTLGRAPRNTKMWAEDIARMMLTLQAIINASVEMTEVDKGGRRYEIEKYKFPFDIPENVISGRVRAGSSVAYAKNLRYCVPVDAEDIFTPIELADMFAREASNLKFNISAENQFQLKLHVTEPLDFDAHVYLCSGGAMIGNRGNEEAVLHAVPLNVDLSAVVIRYEEFEEFVDALVQCAG